MECFVKVLELLYFILLCGRHFVTGQLSSRESLLTSSECDLPNTNLDCSSDDFIAVQKVQYGYRSTCGTACCQYNVTDCLVDASNLQDIIRVCSGQPSCNVPIQQTHDFCSFGTLSASYVYLEYFCIPKFRITDVCSTASIESTDGKPLYLTNVGYPWVTVGAMTCTCSFEAQSCSSDVQKYVIDSDLYQNTIVCQQGLNFTNSEGVTLDAVGCESYYNNYITRRTLSSNYIEITFVSDSTQNKEGFFFIGLTATEPNITISLSCSPQPASWCIDCSTPDSIAYGNITLDVPGDLGYNSSAIIRCHPNYVANTSKIFCKEQSTWEAAACLPKHCGQPMHPVNGIVTLNNKTDTAAGATANISCDSGFEATKATIWCQPFGLWETSFCDAVDENKKDDSVITGIIGAVTGIAATVAVGAVVFLIQKIYRKRKESTTRSVASPDTSNADAVPNYQQLESISAIDAVRNYQQLQPVTITDESDHYQELESVTGTGKL